MKSPITLTLLALVALPLHAERNYDFDSEADFSRYSSAAPLPTSERQLTSGRMSSLMDRRILEAIQEGLRAKGLGPSEEASRADLRFTYHTGSRIETSGYRLGRGMRLRAGRRYREGVLSIDLIDAERRELVWRGWTSAELRQDPDKLEKQIGKLVAKILDGYPPR